MSDPNSTPSTESKQQEKSKPSFFSVENFKSLSILVLVIFAIRWSVASPYYVPTASMEPTIKVGDRLLAWKLSYNLKVPFTDYALLEWSKPQKGDIIVFRYPANPDIDFVKRIVAIEGDELQFIDDILYINGQPQTRIDHNNDRTILEDIADHADTKLLYRENLVGKDHWVIQNKPEFRRTGHGYWPSVDGPPYKVPAGSVFVVGDNRDNSSDSRSWHEVPLSYVRGRALFVIWSVYTPEGENWPSFRFSRFGTALDAYK
jgi:signal peptidase I